MGFAFFFLPVMVMGGKECSPWYQVWHMDGSYPRPTLPLPNFFSARTRSLSPSLHDKLSVPLVRLSHTDTLPVQNVDSQAAPHSTTWTTIDTIDTTTSSSSTYRIPPLPEATIGNQIQDIYSLASGSTFDTAYLQPTYYFHTNDFLLTSTSMPHHPYPHHTRPYHNPHTTPHTPPPTLLFTIHESRTYILRLYSLYLQKRILAYR